MIKFIKSLIIKFFFYNPICKRPIGTRENYIKIFENIRSKSYPTIDEFEEKNGFKIDKQFLDELALKTQITIKKSENNYQHGRVLYSVLCDYISNKNINSLNIFEVGTARGFSSLCMSKALKDSKINGNIFTCDIIPHNKKIFWNCILDHDNKKKTRFEIIGKWTNLIDKINFFHGTCKEAQEKHNFGRINFAFIDAQHEYDDVKIEFDFISSHQEKDDIIIFDDIQEKFPGVKLLIDEIESYKNYRVLKLFSTSERGYAICRKN